MEMEVLVVPSRNMDDRFDFNSARSSPMGSPRSPRGFGDFYCSAPTSPNRLTEFYREFDEFLIAGDGGRRGGDSVSAPKSDEFAFDIGGGGDDWDKASLSAAELFDGGVIKPMTPPPPMAAAGKSRKSGFMPPKSPISVGKRMISGALSPRGKCKTQYEKLKSVETETSPERRQRGRDRAPATARQPSRRETRSLSPLRVSQYPWEEEEDKKTEQPSSSSSSSSTIVKPPAPAPATTSSASAKSALASLSKKWRLKDFFLFRSASEGRAADKDPLKKYTAAYNSSTRNSGSFSDSSRRTRGRVSAHELHYKTNKAVSDDMKKKTFLPYKQGILGRLAFNPAVNALANGFGLSHKK